MSDAIDRMMLLFALFAVALVGLRGYRWVRTRQRSMPPAELLRRLEDGQDLLVLDVRNPDEFVGALGHVTGAINLPVQELSARLTTLKAELPALRDTTLVVACKSGVRSSNALWLLEWAGMKNVYVLKGGMLAWGEAGYPVAHL
ncbi:MAG TPA: rhodanese-like domain-containing protein [Patescibacteria group bacterium]|nr:rhodanese-like domain-containing protein [Patescibacteria group bacterium]